MMRMPARPASSAKAASSEGAERFHGIEVIDEPGAVAQKGLHDGFDHILAQDRTAGVSFDGGGEKAAVEPGMVEKGLLNLTGLPEKNRKAP